MDTFKDIPRNIKEAITQVLSSWSAEEKDSFKNLTVVDLLNLSNTLGSDIRNTFSLWYGNPELLTDCEKLQNDNQEIYSHIYKVQKELEKKLKEEIEATNDFDLVDILESEEDSKDQSDSEMDPYIASQIIIFAVWMHLQDGIPNI